MVALLTQTSTLRWRGTDYTISAALKQMLLLSAVITLIWWGVGLVLPAEGRIRWGDQREQYLTGFAGLQRPYDAPGFFNPPWTLIFLLPFNFVPFEIAVLLQALIYHATLTIIAFIYTPANLNNNTRRIAALAILISPFPADLALEFNNDWIPALGLIVPPALSAPFILAKPQNAIGYYFALSWRHKVRSVLVGSATVVLSFLIWGFDWPARVLYSIERDNLGYDFNAAPSAIFGWPFAIALGSLLIVYTLYRVHVTPAPAEQRQQQQRDLTLYAIIGGMCFMPYIAGYSLALIYALLAAKVPRIMLGLNALLWIGAIVAVLLLFV